jgi:hypothetical protein
VDASVEDAPVEAAASFDDESPFVPDDAGSCMIPGVVCPGAPAHCPDGGGTSLSGKVFDPAGRTPLYNVIVFVPKDPNALPALVPGTSTCAGCPTIGDYVSATQTDPGGAFTLRNVPAGKNVPLVVQAGKWRRKVSLPNVVDCQDTSVPPELTRLPRNRTEGDLPQMAILTGGCDGLGCFLRRIGVDAQEFTGPDVSGRVHVYRGGIGASPDLQGGGGGMEGDCTGASGPCPLWSTRQELERYDEVLLSCECAENNKTKPDRTPMHDWIEEGGSVIAIHDQETWFKNGPADFQAVATWAAPDAGSPGPWVVDTSFTPGHILDQWLGNVGALSATGLVPLTLADLSVNLGSINGPSTGWIYDRSTGATARTANVQYLSFFSTPSLDGGPMEGPECGRAILTDVHVDAVDPPNSTPIPESCSTGDLSPEEKILEFLFFSDVPQCPPSPTPWRP